MIDIGLGISTEKNTALAAEEAVRNAKKNKRTAGKPGLAILFCTSDIPYSPLLKTLNSLLEDTPLIGMSGPAVFSQEGILAHGVLLMLLDFPPDAHFTTAHIKDLKSRPAHEAGEELGESLLFGFKHMQRTVALALFDKVIEEGSNFITGMQEHLGTSFPCLGACAADQLTLTKNRLLFNQTAISDGCCGALFGGKLNFGYGIQHGWKPLGKPRVITNATGNSIKTINYQPAVKLYEEYLATTLTDLKKEIGRLSISYPIGIKIEGEERYLIRNVIMIDDNGSLHCQGNIPQGAAVRLMISTKETCLNATEMAIDDSLTSLAAPAVKFAKESTSKFAIAFSSFSRYTLLRRDAAKELEMVKQGLGEIPFIGIYTASELAPLGASSYHRRIYFQNQTFSCLLMEG
jgi:hypothetical protein